MEILEILGLGDLHLEIWLNSWQKRSDLSLEDVGKFLGREVRGTVMQDTTEVVTSINEGVPLVKSAPNLALCRELKGLAGHFLEGGEEIGDRQSRWGWLRFLKRNK